VLDFHCCDKIPEERFILAYGFRSSFYGWLAPLLLGCGEVEHDDVE
jgi:hypothetical protein